MKFEIKAKILVILTMEEYDMNCPLLHERRSVATRCVTLESAHYLTSIRSGKTATLVPEIAVQDLP